MAKWVECDGCKEVKSSKGDVSEVSVMRKGAERPLLVMDLCNNCINSSLEKLPKSEKVTVVVAEDPKKKT